MTPRDRARPTAVSNWRRLWWALIGRCVRCGKRRYFDGTSRCRKHYVEETIDVVHDIQLEALLDQQAEMELLRDFAQKCIDITCSVIEGDTRQQSGEHLWTYVVEWPHWKEGLLHIDIARLDAWRKERFVPSKTLRPFEIRRASAEGELLGRIEALNVFEAAIIAAQEFFSRPAAFREPGSAGAAGAFRARRGKDDGGELFFVREALPSRQG